MYYTKNCT